MKKIKLTTILFIYGLTVFAQNTFPTPSGDVGIGTLSPSGTLHIRTSQLTSVNPAHWSDDLIVEGNDHVGISLFSPTNRTGHIQFGTSSNNDAARIHYQHDTNKMQFATLGNFALTIDGSQRVGIGTQSPRTILNISSTAPAFDIYDSDGSTDSKSWQMGVTPNVMHFSVRNDANTSGSDYLRIVRSANTISRVEFPNGQIGIGTTSPSARLHVTSNSLGNIAPAVWSDDLILENNDHTGLTIFSASNKVGHILFGNPNNNDAARIHFQHDTNKMQFATQGTKALTIDGNQNIGIGTENPKSKLAVNGQIRATEVKVLADISVPDYVFEPDYELRTLKDTKEYIEENKHLPEIPSATEIGQNGIDLGDMNMRLLKKIEELTLYIIEQNEQIEELKISSARIDELEKQIEQLKKN